VDKFHAWSFYLKAMVASIDYTVDVYSISQVIECPAAYYPYGESVLADQSLKKLSLFSVQVC
jgi:hypothetical protein